MIWYAASTILGVLAAVLMWQGIREQQEREDQQAHEDSGAIPRS